MNISQKEAVAALVSHPVKWNCPLSQYTSFSVGGPANAVITVDRRDELANLLIFLAGEEVEWRIIGRGTNLLVKDSGFPGVILILGKEFQTISSRFEDGSENIEVKVVGGCSLGRFSLNCMDKGFSGLEFA